MIYNFLNIEKGIKYLSEKKQEDSDTYLAVRKKENRILSDDLVTKLPHLSFNEWPVRKKSSERFMKYLFLKNDSLNILDIGCGNGWFTNQMALISDRNFIIGLDINSLELEQAARVFKKKNLEFVYGDVFEIQENFQEKFDIITLNGVIQYFPAFFDLINTLELFLKPLGEIHIMDSPFYTKEKISEARKRTEEYYSSIGFPEMANNYFHHDIQNLKDFELLYSSKQNLFHKIIRKKDSPFSWWKFKINSSL
jgi:ubiquinone/menaquinone biosynthesis C-methylase UbiE